LRFQALLAVRILSARFARQRRQLKCIARQ